MGSRNKQGGRLPAETHSGAGHEVLENPTPGGPPSESAPDADHSHVTLKVSELRRLIHPQPAD